MIHDAPEYYSFKEGLNSSHFGLRAAQNTDAWTALSLLLDAEQPGFILELGSGVGGLTLMIGLWARANGAVFYAYDKNDVRQFPDLYEPLRIQFFAKHYDGFERHILEAVAVNRRVMCLCDGGNKLDEFQKCVNNVAPGDLILVHDYSKGGVRDKNWGWCEAKLEDFSQYPVTPVYETLLETSAWGAFRKNKQEG